VRYLKTAIRPYIAGLPKESFCTLHRLEIDKIVDLKAPEELVGSLVMDMY
jgi:hypothetical protein